MLGASWLDMGIIEWAELAGTLTHQLTISAMKRLFLSVLVGLNFLVPLTGRCQTYNFFLETNNVTTNFSIYNYCHPGLDGVVTLTVPSQVVVDSRCSSSNFTWNIRASSASGIVSVSYEGEFNSTARIAVRGTFQLFAQVSKAFNLCPSGSCTGPTCTSYIARNFRNSEPVGPGEHAVNVTANGVPQTLMDAMTVTPVSPICAGRDLTVQINNWSPELYVQALAGGTTNGAEFGNPSPSLGFWEPIHNGNGNYTLRSTYPLSPGTYFVELKLSSQTCNASRTIRTNVIVEAPGPISRWNYAYTPPGTTLPAPTLPSTLCLGRDHTFNMRHPGFAYPVGTSVRWTVSQPAGNQIVSNPDVTLPIGIPYIPTLTGTVGDISLTASFVPAAGFATSCPNSSLPPVLLKVSTNVESNYSYRYNNQPTLPAYICGDESVGYQVVSTDLANPPSLVTWQYNNWVSNTSVQPTTPGGTFIPRAQAPSAFGTAVVRARVTNSCGAVLLPPIEVKIGRPPVTLNVPASVCEGQPFLVSVVNPFESDFSNYNVSDETKVHFDTRIGNDDGSGWTFIARPGAAAFGGIPRTIKLFAYGVCSGSLELTATVNVKPGPVLSVPSRLCGRAVFVGSISNIPSGMKFYPTAQTRSWFDIPSLSADGSVANPASITFMPKQGVSTGNYQIAFDATPTNYCPAPLQLVKELAVVPPPAFTINTSRSQVCSEQTFTVDLTYIDGVSYAPFPQTAQAFTITPLPMAGGRVRYHLTPNAGQVGGSYTVGFTGSGYCASTQDLSAARQITLWGPPSLPFSYGDVSWVDQAYNGPACTNLTLDAYAMLRINRPIPADMTVTWELLIFNGSNAQVFSSYSGQGSNASNFTLHVPQGFYPAGTTFGVRIVTQSGPSCDAFESFHCGGVLQNFQSICGATPCPPEPCGYQVWCEQTYSVAPNPASEVISIEEVTDRSKLKTTQPSKESKALREYQIISMQGRVVSRGTLEGERQRVDIQSLVPGSYVLIIHSGDRLISRQTFFKK